MVWLFCAVAGHSSAAGLHYVFAHYMVCFATYGETVDAYKREIQEAQAAGIDGFAMNVGAWDSSQGYYQKRVGLLYDAAEQLNTGFKLFFSVDFGDATNVVKMVEAFGNRPASFRYQNRMVLSTYGQNDVPSQGWLGLDWTNAVIGKLKQDGYSIFFIPFFISDPVRELPNYANGASILQKYGGLLDGLFYWGAGGLPPELAASNSNYNRATHDAGKVSMSSIAPTYWGHKQPTLGRRYYEFDGGEGIVSQWLSIITNQPDWVEIVTWNDFNESTYVSPVDDPGQYFAELKTPFRNSHKGYLELSKRYIAWYKTGAPPPISRDELYYFYRPHPKDAVATDTNDVPVTWRTGNVQDTLNATVFLTAPASLEIVSGATSTTNSLPAGMSHVRVPFSVGPQILTLRRNGATVVSVQGPDIPAQIQNYDFFTTTGNIYGPDVRPAAPTDLQIRSPFE
jgi:glucan endo-1,3-alpha-glucosidase